MIDMSDDDQKSILTEIDKELEILTELHKSPSDNYTKVLYICKKKNIGNNFAGFIEHEIARFLKSNSDIYDEYKTISSLYVLPEKIQHDQLELYKIANDLVDEVNCIKKTIETKEVTFGEKYIIYINTKYTEFYELFDKLKIVLDIPKKYKSAYINNTTDNEFNLVFRLDHYLLQYADDTEDGFDENNNESDDAESDDNDNVIIRERFNGNYKVKFIPDWARLTKSLRADFGDKYNQNNLLTIIKN